MPPDSQFTMKVALKIARLPLLLTGTTGTNCNYQEESFLIILLVSSSHGSIGS